MATKAIKKEVAKKGAATKKVVKKIATKKVVATKEVTKKSSKKAVTKTAEKKVEFKALVCAIDGECFWTRDGRILQNLADLHIAFGSMDDEIFLHHANTEKNDFADWVEYVLQDLDAAVLLRTTKKRTQAEKMLKEHLSSYSL